MQWVAQWLKITKEENIQGWQHYDILMSLTKGSKPRWWKVEGIARVAFSANIWREYFSFNIWTVAQWGKVGKVARVVKSCIWEIPCLPCVLSVGEPIKVEHMKSHSNLTMPNSCPNDEWREHFQTRGLSCFASHCLAFVQFELISFSFGASMSLLTVNKKCRESLLN